MCFYCSCGTVEPSELLTKVLAACKEGDKEKIEGLICGAIKHVRNNRFKPDQTVVLTLFYLTKTQPTFFVSDLISEVLHLFSSTFFQADLWLILASNCHLNFMLYTIWINLIVEYFLPGACFGSLVACIVLSILINTIIFFTIPLLFFDWL